MLEHPTGRRHPQIEPVSLGQGLPTTRVAGRSLPDHAKNKKGSSVDASPIIPWIGGKRRLADRLLPLFPPHDCYVELFCGGAAIYFLRPVPAPVEVINDVNGDLVNLYRVVQHHLEEFVRQFKWALTSRQSSSGSRIRSPRP